MKKHLLDAALLSGTAMNRARGERKALGPGLVRLNQAEKGAAEMLVYGEIGGWWDGINAEDVVKELMGLEADELHLRVNSPGGSVFEGVTIYNAVAQLDIPVIAHVEGLAASIASVIICAADEIRIGEFSNIMIHKPWGLILGDAEEMRHEAGVLDKLEDGILAVYEARSGKSADELRPLVAAETWFRGQEAVDIGLADSVTPNKTKQKDGKRNSLRQPLLNLFKHTPKDLLPDEQDDPKVRQFEKLLRDGEGRSNADAKRLASLAARVFGTDRDDQEPAPRDEEDHRDLHTALQAQTLSAFLRNIR